MTDLCDLAFTAEDLKNFAVFHKVATIEEWEKSDNPPLRISDVRGEPELIEELNAILAAKLAKAKVLHSSNGKRSQWWHSPTLDKETDPITHTGRLVCIRPLLTPEPRNENDGKHY